MVDRYLEKVYAGFLGMNAGIRLGAPVEPTIWTYDRIREAYGEITNYVKDYINFAADDDANGPVFFLRALLDDAKDRAPMPQDVARAWLNYAREGVGMFWWGGYGVSTEHTAYLNLKHGIEAPRSGSMEQNGATLAEQIGGQIFIDTWGLVNPREPTRAADYGEAAARVSHDGNGVYGARFMCAAIAKAFETSEIDEIIDAGLAEIPAVCTYRSVVEAVRAFHLSNEGDWRECYKMLDREWGYDRYPGVCHIIPNAGVCIMALLYGNRQFDRTIEIATMAGWDTDCNAGNVGTILGVACGIDGIPRRYLDPINDGIVCSGISGYLNILDVPSFCREVALLGYRIAGEEAPAQLTASYRPGEVNFDFSLPGSTHNIRVSNSYFCRAVHATAPDGNEALRITMDRMVRGDQCRVFYKPFYTRADFSDERYSPVFSPTVYPGQTVFYQLYLDQWNGIELPAVIPYVRACRDGKLYTQGYFPLKQGDWTALSFTVPDLSGDVCDEVGFIIESASRDKQKLLGNLYLREFRVFGKSRYTLSMAKARREFAAITPFSMDGGAWTAENGSLFLMNIGRAMAYTGNYYARNYRIQASVTPLNGESHLLVCRAQGAMRSYAAGLAADGKAVITKNDFGYRILEECDFEWKKGTTYQLEIACEDSRITLSIDGKAIMTVTDDSFLSGMFGFGSLSMGRTQFGDIEFQEF